ncbi:MAG TPA: hypothetical protein VKP13_13665 [Nitrospira sp.]|nr:hypothetical protein [Nitrospira sp.]
MERRNGYSRTDHESRTDVAVPADTIGEARGLCTGSDSFITTANENRRADFAGGDNCSSAHAASAEDSGDAERRSSLTTGNLATTDPGPTRTGP